MNSVLWDSVAPSGAQSTIFIVYEILSVTYTRFDSAQLLGRFSMTPEAPVQCIPLLRRNLFRKLSKFGPSKRRSSVPPKVHQKFVELLKEQVQEKMR